MKEVWFLTLTFFSSQPAVLDGATLGFPPAQMRDMKECREERYKVNNDYTKFDLEDKYRDYKVYARCFKVNIHLEPS